MRRRLAIATLVSVLLAAPMWAQMRGGQQRYPWAGLDSRPADR
jgi:hypothetical protein